MSTRLTEILEDQYAEAKAKAGTRIRRHLKNGLTVQMQYIHPYITVTLARQLTFPAPAEWDTIMKYFPFDTPKVTPLQQQVDNYFILTATISANHLAHQLKF